MGFLAFACILLVLLSAWINAKLIAAPERIRKFWTERANLTISTKTKQGGPPTFLIYIISHSDATFKIAQNYSALHTWAVPVMIQSTKYLESSTYLELFPHRYNDWKDLDYVGMMSYKVASAIEYGTQITGLNYHSVGDIEHLAQVGIEKQYDVIPFVRTRHPMLQVAQQVHGSGFTNAWYTLLWFMEFEDSTIDTYSNQHAYYKNAFLMRPEFMKELSGLMSEALLTVDYEDSVRVQFEQDGRYQGNPEVRMRVYHKPYYELHSFVFERLPVFFLSQLHAKVCMENDDAMCSINDYRRY